MDSPSITLRQGDSVASASASLAAQIYPLPVTIQNDTNRRLILPRWLVNLNVGASLSEPIELADKDTAIRLITDLLDMLALGRDGTFGLSFPDAATILVTDTQEAADAIPEECRENLCLSSLLAMSASIIATQRTIIHLTNQEKANVECC